MRNASTNVKCVLSSLVQCPPDGEDSDTQPKEEGNGSIDFPEPPLKDCMPD